jgi:hypothetical protein
MAEYIASGTTTVTSADLTITTPTVFTLVGNLNNENSFVEIRKKNSNGTYKLISQVSQDGQNSVESVLSNKVRTITIVPPSAGITIQVYKPTSTSAVGVDKD